MKRKWAVILVVLIAIVAVASVSYIYLIPETEEPENGEEIPETEEPEKVEEIGGNYNVVINYWEGDRITIEYTDEIGEHSGDFLLNMKDSLDWIKTRN